MGNGWRKDWTKTIINQKSYHGKKQCSYMKCACCGNGILSLPFICNHCGQPFCVDCRIPEEHGCQVIKRNWENYFTYSNYSTWIKQGSVANFR